jgi:hypothetical protein
MVRTLKGSTNPRPAEDSLYISTSSIVYYIYYTTRYVASSFEEILAIVEKHDDAVKINGQNMFPMHQKRNHNNNIVISFNKFIYLVIKL